MELQERYDANQMGLQRLDVAKRGYDLTGDDKMAAELAWLALGDFATAHARDNAQRVIDFLKEIGR